MLFFKKVCRKLGQKILWFPQLVTVGKPARTREIAARLSRMSTVSPGDVYAVLADLPSVMSDLLAEGRVVHLDWVGSFYLACTSRGNGVETPEEVTPEQIKGIKVVFLPERTRLSNRKMKRPLVTADGEFTEWVKQ